jgi:hypothetical protein
VRFCRKDFLALSSSIGLLAPSTFCLQAFTYKTKATTYENIFMIAMTNAKEKTY